MPFDILNSAFQNFVFRIIFPVDRGRTRAGFPVPGFMNPTPGFGGGMGRGRGWWGRGFGRGGCWGGGWGRRNMFYATGLTGWQRAGMQMPAYGMYGVPPVTPENELEALQGQAEYFSSALENIRKRIEELEAEAAKK